MKEKNPSISSVSFLRVFAVVSLVFAVLVFIAWKLGYLGSVGAFRPSNAVMVIQPYKYVGTWVFDDHSVGLRQEPFVQGIPEMIDSMVKDIPDAEKGFRLLFSGAEFPGYTQKLIWMRQGNQGNWYYNEQLKMEGWLCPALFRYFKEAPKEIYAKAEPLE
ncbi:MAG: hypothetical protein Kow00107_05280 [Planctomycetota bacterium]